LLPPPSDLPHVARRIAPLCALARRHRDTLDGLDDTAAADRLAELNVLEQVRLLRASPIVQGRERPPLVHGWIFSLADGRLLELDSGYTTPPVDVEPVQAATADALG
ncbi:carbonic anhydrase, partial [Burkholderia ubonensis]